MGLFKKKKVGGCSCDGCSCSSNNGTDNAKDAYVKVLGVGCKKCLQLEKNAVAALSELGMNTNVGHLTDMAEIAAYGVISTPALVINEKVVSYGKVLSSNEIIKLLK